jgi:hypothetical protein
MSAGKAALDTKSHLLDQNMYWVWTWTCMAAAYH